MYAGYVSINKHEYLYLVLILSLHGLRGGRSETTACRPVMCQAYTELLCSGTIPRPTHTSCHSALAPSFEALALLVRLLNELCKIQNHSSCSKLFVTKKLTGFVCV